MTNTAATGGYVKGSKTAKKIERSECKEAQKVADKGKDKLPEDFKDSNNFTIAGIKVLEGNALKPSFSKANTLLSKIPDIFKFFLKGLPVDSRPKGQPLCNGDTYKFSKGKGEMAKQLGAHSEARGIAELAKRGLLQGRSIVMNVNLTKTNQNGKPIHKMPCASCHRLICNTMKSCDTKIYMCNYNNEFVDMSEYCDDSGKKDKLGRTAYASRGKLRTILEPLKGKSLGAGY